jgi:hypothetical protein
MLLPSCISSNPLLISASGMRCVIIGSISILPSMYQSTILGTSVAAARAAECRPLPDAAGDQLEWSGRDFRARRGDADDQPRWHASSAWRITATLPVQSKV